jgi:hypothetical protein
MQFTRIFHESVMLSIKDLIHKGTFRERVVLIDTANRENFFVDQRLSENIADS